LQLWLISLLLFPHHTAYMTLQCAPACFSCEQLSFEARCPMPENFTEHNIWGPGDLNRMFETILTHPYYQEQQQYQVNVLLRPDAKRLSPWVVVVDNFLTEVECDTLIRLGGEQGYQQSKDVGAKQFDGTYDSNLSPGRTSTNAWCLNECFDHEITKGVLHKIENITGIPDSNSEYLQLLKYEEGQFYEQHHDYIHFHIDRAQGVRILTVFLYLNDVEEGTYLWGFIIIDTLGTHSYVRLLQQVVVRTFHC
jgi:prolyl 4-hydroxylase